MPIVLGASRQVCTVTGTMLSWRVLLLQIVGGFLLVWWWCVFSCLGRCARTVLVCFPSVCCCLYCFKMLLKNVCFWKKGCFCSQRSLGPGLLLVLLCTSSGTQWLLSVNTFRLSDIFTFLRSSPQICQLWWHQPSLCRWRAMASTVKWSPVQQGGVSFLMLCSSLHFKLPLDRIWGFCSWVLRLLVCPGSWKGLRSAV